MTAIQAAGDILASCLLTLQYCLTGLFALLISKPTEVRSNPGIGQAQASSRQQQAFLSELKRAYPPDIFPGGRYVRLPAGQIRLWEFGQQEATKRIVFVHGLSIPSIIFESVAKALCKQGYRVALYDQYGRGYSSAPQNVAYDSVLYVNQLLGVLDALGWSSAHLVGLSMGGPISARFASLFPHRVESVTLLAPAGMQDRKPSRAIGIKLVPYIEKSVTTPIARALFRSMIPVRAPSKTKLDRLLHVARLQAAVLPGFQLAILRTLHQGPLFGFESAYYDLGKVGMPVLVIWGTADSIVPYAASSSVMRALGPKATLLTLDGAGHDLPHTTDEEVTKALLAFIS
ncbi:uncharacterized protein L969DRAFT_16307 [Mixia osmundae IAM 14324]|uniref:AB hydrolase-1 domain-containing protein n=1 Tax=Mixia osmundae (strain CBS 9802 / IAM 14324 / JCM 22182 / KY 12970) TaxID=764103 RepID=G7DU29_MIXOS|nr:uncharacterized protein L969DRAFT_16307 [Mixia osmundae IAM 14324]KEI40956.1 hypothetical protein L969DRAFT_16307 [Mixia osmundae IAM 14324]GAA94089.1 hypothetical protein E5Q_00736 [Mixia osmundae IAM 14324]